MNTQDLMNSALELAGLKEMPEDCGIIVPGDNIKKILMGVDMDTPELLLARQLGYDCVVSHHPRNTNPNMLELLKRHIYKLEALGVPRNKSQKLLEERREELSYNSHVSNSRRSESAAKLLGMPFMCLHTPADIISEATVQKHLDSKFAGKVETKLQEVLDALNELNEYKNSARKPVIRVGNKESYAGKIYVLMAGLTGPGADITKEYFEAGVGTLIRMHITEKDAKAVKEQKIGNVIVAGHMSSDSIGLNKIAQMWRGKGIEITLMSGIVV
ncbi:MAG: Nif3-like dinuclear metal center hexameric protein [Treponema sp.]|nr:Nif3-like dinuclear metal center hexameric protein [Treponema sp.]